MLRSLLSGLVLSVVVFSGELMANPGKWITFLSHHPSQQKALQSQRVSSAVIKQASNSMHDLEQAVHSQINQYRTQRGLSPLTLDARISQQARLHSQAMASKRVPFSHQGFEQRIQAIATVIPYRAAAENVAYNQGYQNPGIQAVQGWIKSPGHLKNIKGQYNLTGIGIAKDSQGQYYFTQIFILRR